MHESTAAEAALACQRSLIGFQSYSTSTTPEAAKQQQPGS
jgi:hypothetical protein